MSNHLDYEINKELGECYLFMGDMDKAEEYYLKAAGSNGVHPEPYLGLATIAVHRGELDQAMRMYRKAASIAPSDKAAAGIGLLEMESGAHARAFDKFSEALRLNPENIVAIFGLVQVGHVLHRLAEVTPFLDACLELAPGKDDVRFALAACLASLGSTGDAARHLEIILEHDPNNVSARDLFGQCAAKVA